LISHLLTNAGFDVMTAEDGIKAWELFQKIGHDLVITDLQMPGINGFFLAETSRSSARPQS